MVWSFVTAIAVVLLVVLATAPGAAVEGRPLATDLTGEAEVDNQGVPNRGISTGPALPGTG